MEDMDPADMEVTTLVDTVDMEAAMVTLEMAMVEVMAPSMEVLEAVLMAVAVEVVTRHLILDLSTHTGENSRCS